jgi:multisubunit Na+/H+ antiporter MnhB subunit
MKNFLEDKQGIYWVWIVAIPMVIVVTLSWLIAVFVLNVSLDFLSTAAAAAHPSGAAIIEGQRVNSAIFVVIVDVLILAWAAVSSFKRERQEYPL